MTVNNCLNCVIIKVLYRLILLHQKLSIINFAPDYESNYSAIYVSDFP
jgi:hypothetical protein